jgi:hypothetical protein
MDSEPKHNPDPRACTCHPDDKPPTPCARKYALRDCRIADVARRLHFAADVAELREQIELRALARELEAV